MPREQSLELADTRLDYLLYDHDGPTVILLHATGFNPWLWHPVARAMSGHYRVIAPYFCDYRMADPEHGGLGWYQLASDLVAFCDQLRIETPYVVGHSMGGAVPVIASGRLGLKPAKMLLIEPILLPREVYSVKIRVEDHPLAGKSIKRRNHWENSKEAKTYFKSKPLFQSWDPEVLDLYLQYGTVASDGGIALACHPRQEAALFMGSMAYDPWPAIEKVECPVLVLEGEHTENKGFIDFKKAADTFPKGHYRVIEGTGHLIPMEAPGRVVSEIREFFGEGS